MPKFVRAVTDLEVLQQFDSEVTVNTTKIDCDVCGKHCGLHESAYTQILVDFDLDDIEFKCLECMGYDQEDKNLLRFFSPGNNPNQIYSMDEESITLLLKALSKTTPNQDEIFDQLALASLEGLEIHPGKYVLKMTAAFVRILESQETLPPNLQMALQMAKQIQSVAIRMYTMFPDKFDYPE